MAIRAAYKAFSDPDSQVRDMSREERQESYGNAWAYYRSSMFSRRNGEDWSTYLAARDLYKHTRLIYNPVPMIVDFYVDNIWQPSRSEAFAELESLVTPITQRTDSKVAAAIAQIDQWSNFQADAQKIKRYAAATGNVLIEGVDDPIRQKVIHRCVWPGYVTHIELNETGDVQAYVIEYDVYDRDAKTHYRFRKEVTKEEFKYFRDDKPFTPAWAKNSVEKNPYEFCFAVWIRHTDDGSEYGLPAVADFNKVDEVNSLGSHLHDNIHKAIESPKIVSTDKEILPLIGSTSSTDGRRLIPQDPRLNWVVFKTGLGASVLDLAGSLALAEANPYLSDCLKSFTDDYAELQASAIIRDNAQLSGAALERMLGPAQNALNGVAPNYNQQLIKLRQMQLAVAGMRINGGGWSTDKQKELFRPFGLESYSRGELDFALEKASLVQSTEAENEDLLMKKATRSTTLAEIVDTREQLSIAGYSEEQIVEIQARKKEENKLEFDDPTPPNKDDPEPESVDE